MRIAIYYSSITGNTKRLAEYLTKVLSDVGEQVSLYQSAMEKDLCQADLYIIAYWCRRGGMDDLSIQTLEKCQGKKVMAVGTIGGNAAGPYGQRVIHKVEETVREENICIASLICQGMINPKRTEIRRNLPVDDPHYLDDENYARHLANRGRPNEEDLKKITEIVLQKIYSN